jgi:hypothetical protein
MMGLNPEWADELPNPTQTSLGSSPSQPMTPAKRVRAGTPPTPTRSPSKAVPHIDGSDPIDDDHGSIALLSDDEIIQHPRARSSDMPPAKKFKFNRTEESVLPVNSSRMADSPSLMKTPVQKTSQWQAIRDVDDPVGHPVSHTYLRFIITHNKNNPFHDHAATIADARSPKQSLSSPTTSVAAGDSIQQAVDILGAVPETVRRLERKLNAAEKARDIKAARIFKLEKDIEEYVIIDFKLIVN